MAEDGGLAQGLHGIGQTFAAKGQAAIFNAPAAHDADGVVAGLNTRPAAASSKDAAAAVGGYGDAGSREAVLTQIFQTLPLLEIFELGAERGMLQVDSVKALPAAAQQRLAGLARQEIELRDVVLTHDLVVSNGQDLTLDQLQEVLAVARVPMIQQAIMAGASGNTGNISQPSSADQIVLTRAEKEPFVMAFLQTITLDVAGNDLQSAFAVSAWRLANTN